MIFVITRKMCSVSTGGQNSMLRSLELDSQKKYLVSQHLLLLTELSVLITFKMSMENAACSK